MVETMEKSKKAAKARGTAGSGATVKTLRQPTLATLGLGTVLDIFRTGRLPADPSALVDEVFGPPGDRGCMVISGANGIVGAGKTMQFASRLQPYGVPVVALDFPGAPDGIGKQYPGLVRGFGKTAADRIMGSIVRLTYDGKALPAELKTMRPRFLLEAIPEVLDIKRAHYEVFRAAFPGIEIRSVTSGFPASELGVGVAHPAFPHEINKIWEIVENEPSAVTKLFWALGLIPLPVGDHWSFILDVLFCGIALAGLRYHDATNMPYWKVDKFVRKLLGPNPFRAHDAIGAKGADFLTWSCLHHLANTYGDLFTPTADLVERKETGQDWYPPNHFRPLVDWKLSDEEQAAFRTWILGPLFQMTSLMLHENRAHLAHMNAIGELCAQFRKGILTVMRDMGPEAVIETVEAYRRLHPEAASDKSWFPHAVKDMSSPEWQQLYVNAEHDGTVGVVTLGRESYGWDVDAELNRALDWLRAEGIERVIVTGDFHISTQMVGADTSDFYAALEDVKRGLAITEGWSRTARRLGDEFRTSVAMIPGKRCLGGMLELMVHCHHVVAVADARLGWPEVGLPVVPGMEGCHWPFRKAPKDAWPRILEMLLTGRPVAAADAVGWLVDYAGPLEDALAETWRLASEADGATRPLAEGVLKGVPTDVPDLPEAESPAAEVARMAIVACVRGSCAATLAEAHGISAKLAADFLAGPECRAGAVGAEYEKTMIV
jgi:enoyl-CoA hydratase/carnithine racemase/3-hydroxyacyl-CoA dehydrogenase